LDNEIDRKIDVTAILFLLVQKRQQTHDWTLIGSGANGLGIQEWPVPLKSFFDGHYAFTTCEQSYLVWEKSGWKHS